MTTTATGRAGRLAAATAFACLAAALGGCDESGGSSGRDSDRSVERPAEDRAAPQQRGPRTTIDAAPGPLDDLPRKPADDDAAGLASQIARVEAVLRDPDAAATDVRRAAEFEQLAGRTLAQGPEGYAEAVLDQLRPELRVKAEAHMEAAALLDGMSGPVPEFPDWRIVEPPPPGVLVDHYKSAGREVGVPWEYLAAVHLVETRMGRIRGVSTAGAQGPMQFLPTTWDIYGEGGDITDPRDAIFAAARLLRANGAPGDMAEALWHYNPSDSYVGAVTRYAQQIQRSPTAYRGYWHWRVLYEHVDGTAVLEVGYPDEPPKKLP